MSSRRTLGTASHAGNGSVSLSVAVIDRDNRARARLLRLLKDSVAVDAFASVDEMEEAADLDNPGAVVFGPSHADESGLKEIFLLSRDRPSLAAVLVVDELSTDLLHQALRAGVRDVVARPREPMELLEAIDRVAEGFGGRPLAPQSRDGREQGRVVTVVSTKGGVGKSVIASNLGVLLAAALDHPVALVDADLQFGDIALMLKVAPKHTLVDVMATIRRLDPATLRELLLHHERSGLLVLPAPIEPAFADQVGAGDMVRILNVLRSFCAHVVVDTSPQLNDVVLALVDESDDVLIVCVPELSSVKNAKLALQTLRLLNVPLSKVKLVLNRSTSKAKLDRREIEQALQLEVEYDIASDIAVPRSINQGLPVALAAPRSAAGKDLYRLSRALLAREPHLAAVK